MFIKLKLVLIVCSGLNDNSNVDQLKLRRETELEGKEYRENIVLGSVIFWI